MEKQSSAEERAEAKAEAKAQQRAQPKNMPRVGDTVDVTYMTNTGIKRAPAKVLETKQDGRLVCEVQTGGDLTKTSEMVVGPSDETGELPNWQPHRKVEPTKDRS